MRALLFCIALLAPPAAAWAEARVVHLDEASLPQDFKDLGMRGFHLYDLKAVAVFGDRVQFYRFPSDVRLGAGGLADQNGPVSLLQFKPLKILRFSMPFDALSRGYTLICTHPSGPKPSRTGRADFCGIVSLDGRIVYQFPQDQHLPDDMLQIIGMSDDGLYAEVYLGRLVTGLGDRLAQVSQPREILAWWYPDRLVRYPGPWSDGEPKDPRHALVDVFRDFGARKMPPIDTTQ